MEDQFHTGLKREQTIHSVISNIYIAPLQENYSEALPTILGPLVKGQLVNGRLIKQTVSQRTIGQTPL